MELIDGWYHIEIYGMKVPVCNEARTSIMAAFYPLFNHLKGDLNKLDDQVWKGLLKGARRVSLCERFPGRIERFPGEPTRYTGGIEVMKWQLPRGVVVYTLNTTVMDYTADPHDLLMTDGPAI